MSMDRKEETRIVKDALKKAGIPAKVGHGHGTAWGWLHINIGDPTKRNGVNPDTRLYTQEEQDLQARVIKIALKVTGRRGDYDGRINISAHGKV